MRSAIVDIDTSTLQLLIVDDHMRPVVDLCRFVRLDSSGRLDAKAISRCLKVCREVRAVIDANDVGAIHASATKALCDAANASDVITPAEQILGAHIEILTMEREADLLALAVSRTFPELAKTHYLVVDVGDSSTWIIDVVRGRATTSSNVPIGAAQLTARYLRHDPSTGGEQNAVERAIDVALREVERPTGVTVIGTAKTSATIAALELATDDPKRITGLHIAHRFVFSWYMQLARMPRAKRKKLPGIDAERADVIVGGVAIYSRLLTWAGAAELVTSDRGIRWGLAFERASLGEKKPPARRRKPSSKRAS